MKEHDEKIERILLRFRPADPPARLRQRVVPEEYLPQRLRRTWLARLFRAAVAAVLVLSLCLNTVADGMATDAAASVGLGPAIWTKHAEHAAQMLNGDGWGRQYIALGLMASTGRATLAR
ncbi:MAG: hypothetical protein SVV80_11620 [Planctomycetota bacterium]|nr:hypothetical protein [Planctomycetota bacterium]